ncbi:hypothetical protein ETU08_08780 [Apibacter muscae]|uniref:Uncharacterized protein n=1 Tax=Apibacter muscae TaxID=2509004 RepID=A0A563DAH2_9FLAO|nr:hypothetical protein [Apibacter muscae]TWP23230.1 hypothetical protein ETU10_07705 [Apibacter muscae]TWP27308.1 hypothetical protein ETU09_07635 [Apibacter muscae]TWP28529.1 hypothetical protein ETU08_08780 [Apibacter muscae]
MGALLKEIKENRGLRFMNIGAVNFQNLSFNIISIINSCQSHLFNYKKECNKDFIIDVLNLLEIAKSLIPHGEFELLDRLDKISEN